MGSDSSELKQGDGASGGKGRLHSHVRDVDASLASSERQTMLEVEMVTMFNQLRTHPTNVRSIASRSWFTPYPASTST